MFSGPFLGRRVLANLLEQVAFTILLPFAVDPATGWYLVGWLVLFLLMHVVVLSAWGTTPFKWVARIGVRSVDGTKATVGQTVRRASVYAAPVVLGVLAAAIGDWDSETGARFTIMTPRGNVVASGLAIVAWLVGFGTILSIVISRTGRGWPDRFAGTQVVRLPGRSAS